MSSDLTVQQRALLRRQLDVVIEAQATDKSVLEWTVIGATAATFVVLLVGAALLSPHPDFWEYFNRLMLGAITWFWVNLAGNQIVIAHGRSVHKTLIEQRISAGCPFDGDKAAHEKL
jgi:hypothetical protein